MLGKVSQNMQKLLVSTRISADTMNVSDALNEIARTNKQDTNLLGGVFF